MVHWTLYTFVQFLFKGIILVTSKCTTAALKWTVHREIRLLQHRNSRYEGLLHISTSCGNTFVHLCRSQTQLTLVDTKLTQT